MINQEVRQNIDPHPTGYKGIYYSHNWHEIKSSKSFKVSVVLALVLLVTSVFSKLNSYEILKIWAEMTLSIFPNLLGFNLGGYALIIGFGNTELIESFTEKVGSKKNSIFQRLSGIFSFALLVQLFAFILSYLITFLMKLELPVLNNCYSEMVNILLTIILSFSSLFGLLILPTLVVNLFDFGQAHHLYLTFKRLKK